MGTYIVNTPEQQKQMLEAINKTSFDDLFKSVPESVRVKTLDLPAGMSEMETVSAMEEMASHNRVYRHIFRGAGAYDHFIPSIVDRVTKKEEFLTAYTPYQAEISQGILQSIFEYQTMIAELTGMEVSNASVYDGASAAAEASAMCVEKKRVKILVSGTVNPGVTSVIKTYAFGKDNEVCVIPSKDGETDIEALEKNLDDTAACLILQYPNFFGIIEDISKLGEITHASGAKLIVHCDPIALGLLETPAALGADIAVGEGQGLGIPLSFGGPYLGFMATSKKLMRKLPGRIIGKTSDDQGRDAYVLTLQAREQHIRREKASSNICSNEALMALRAAVYLSAMGASGLKEAATLCASKAAYLSEKLSGAGLKPLYTKPFFNEFVTTSDIPADKILKALDEAGILGGLKLNDTDILWCATEKCTRAAMDEAAALVKGVM